LKLLSRLRFHLLPWLQGLLVSCICCGPTGKGSAAMLPLSISAPLYTFSFNQQCVLHLQISLSTSSFHSQRFRMNCGQCLSMLGVVLQASLSLLLSLICMSSLSLGWMRASLCFLQASQTPRVMV